MINNVSTLHILLIEDDPDNLRLLNETLPSDICGYRLSLELCGDFKEARSRIDAHRYDLILSDIYRDTKGKSGEKFNDQEVIAIFKEIQEKRFCPIVAFTDGSKPEFFNENEGPFFKFANKVKIESIIEKLTEVLETGVPELARKLHDDLDQSTSSYLWNFLKDHWDQLKGYEPTILERLVRRRAAILLSRLEPGVINPVELPKVEGLEYYLYPPITSDELRLGEIIRKKGTAEFRVIITPHCFLTKEGRDEPPRAEYVLTIKTIRASEFFQRNPCHGNGLDVIRRYIGCPTDRGKPRGRYCFLPGFLDIPDLYCDLQQLESIKHEDILSEYERIAVLDAPFAEAIQTSLTRFYSSVGLPQLDPEKYQHLL